MLDMVMKWTGKQPIVWYICSYEVLPLFHLYRNFILV